MRPNKTHQLAKSSPCMTSLPPLYHMCCFDFFWLNSHSRPYKVRACVLGPFSHVQLFAILWTVACQAPLSMGFSRQEYWRLPCPPPGDFPNPGIKPASPTSPTLQANSLLLSHQESPTLQGKWCSSPFNRPGPRTQRKGRDLSTVTQQTHTYPGVCAFCQALNCSFNDWWFLQMIKAGGLWFHTPLVSSRSAVYAVRAEAPQECYSPTGFLQYQIPLLLRLSSYYQPFPRAFSE